MTPPESSKRHALTLAAASALVALCALAAGCAARPDIRTQKDPAADLAAYKTFAFYAPVAGDAARYTTLVGARLQQAARSQLEGHHYVYSEDNPDLRVNLALRAAERVELRSVPAGRGFHGYRGWGGALESVDYRQGTLLIDLVDTRRQALVWQGVVEGRLDEQALKNPGPTIEQAVGEVFARFPG